jgi:hypothetical protein
MSMSQTDVDRIPNGPGAAAILAAGIGCAAMGILAFAGDASDRIGKALNFYRSGPCSLVPSDLATKKFW